MRKIFSFIVLSVIFISTTSAYNLSSNDYKIVGKIQEKIENLANKKCDTNSCKEDYKDNLAKSFKTIAEKYKSNLRANAIISELIRTNLKFPEPVFNENGNRVFGVDLDMAKSEWLKWHNTERKNLGLSTYINKDKLDSSALTWSKINMSRGDISHKRDLNDTYYDYNKITSWMSQQGVVCKNINRTTYSESIGIATYHCSGGDCTVEMLYSLENVFKFYMSEKNQTYRPHYNAIAGANYKQIGVGIAIEDLGSNKFKSYITTHYCSELE